MSTIKTFAQHYVGRQEAAKGKFVEYCMSVNGFSKEDAETIFNVYVKLKLITIDGVDATFKFKHGVFGDKEPMQNALKQH